MSLKRTADVDETRRVKPVAVNYQSLTIENISDNTTVHQTCVIISGSCHSFDKSTEDFVSVGVTDCFEDKHASQNWPVDSGKWKAMAMLSPGANTLEIALHHAGGVCESRVISLTLEPLLQLPPLLLAVLVAKDSPLLIDCPPAKGGAISTTHSDLDAAVAKFRMTAYMWQAMTAEDFHAKGLDRRSFRLEEEWSADTTTVTGMQRNTAKKPIMGSVPKVHLVRTEKTVAQLRDAMYAQQNRIACRANELHKIFENALKAHGAPFDAATKPVVAGLILDSTYSVEDDLIVGHAALGCHNPNGLSLGIFGSHLTYAWPRFLEEVPACLLDTKACGSTVGNDNGECDTLREACFVGQGAFLHEVGHAFGARHTTGIMARGYSKHWYKNFLGHTELRNDAVFDLEDALKFKLLPHFKTPGDKPLSQEFRLSNISVEIEGSEEEDDDVLIVSCSAGIVSLKLTQQDGKVVGTFGPNSDAPVQWNIPIAGLDRSQHLAMKVLALNGKLRTVNNIWALLKNRPIIKIPGTDFKFFRSSVKCQREMDNPSSKPGWSMLFNVKGSDGAMHRATAIDLRVGCILDGAVVYYENGLSRNCGLENQISFGGHQSEEQNIPLGEEIVKVEVAFSSWGSHELGGIRMTLSNGTVWGALNDRSDGSKEVTVLQPKDGQKIVGLFGCSSRGSGYTTEFGIITASRDQEIPAAAYDMLELQSAAPLTTQQRRDREDSDDEDEGNASEDSEEYDNESDHTAE